MLVLKHTDDVDGTEYMYHGFNGQAHKAIWVAANGRLGALSACLLHPHYSHLVKEHTYVKV